MSKEKLEKYTRSFAEVVTCIAAGAVAADGIISPNEMLVFRKIITHNPLLKVFDNGWLMERFETYLELYKESMEEETDDYMDVEQMLFKELSIDERMAAAGCAWALIAQNGVTQEELDFMERVCGPNLLDTSLEDVKIENDN